MPVRRRVDKHRAQYPEAIEQLISGAPVDETPENRGLMLGIEYFNKWPDLPAEARARARDLLREWRPRHLAKPFRNLST